MGTVGLQRVRNNRLLIVVAEHDDQLFVNAAINAVNELGPHMVYG